MSCRVKIVRIFDDRVITEDALQYFCKTGNEEFIKAFADYLQAEAEDDTDDTQLSAEARARVERFMRDAFAEVGGNGIKQ
jgi:hypothetical protein